MAFAQLDAKKLSLKSQIQQFNNIREQEEQLQLNGLKTHLRNNKFNCKINEDYQKVFEKYNDKVPVNIKPKIFQKGKVKKIFEELEEDLSDNISKLAPLKINEQSKLNHFEQNKQNQTNVVGSQKNEDQQSKTIDDIQQELNNFVRIHHQNSYQNQFDQIIHSKSDQNLKKALEQLEQMNTLSYEVDYNPCIGFDKVSINNKEQMKVKTVKIEQDETKNKHQFLPSIITNKQNRSYSPQRNSQDILSVDLFSRNQQEQSIIQKQKQILLINKQEPYIIKKYKKSTLNLLDDIINQFIIKICNTKSNSQEISLAIIELITKVFTLRQTSSHFTHRFAEIVENLYFCKKTNPLFEIFQQEISQPLVEEYQHKVCFKEISLILLIELIEQKNINAQQISQLVQERDELLEKIKNLNQAVIQNSQIQKESRINDQCILDQINEKLKQTKGQTSKENKKDKYKDQQLKNITESYKQPNFYLHLNKGNQEQMDEDQKEDLEQKSDEENSKFEDDNWNQNFKKKKI